MAQAKTPPRSRGSRSAGTRSRTQAAGRKRSGSARSANRSAARSSNRTRSSNSRRARGGRTTPRRAPNTRRDAVTRAVGKAKVPLAAGGAAIAGLAGGVVLGRNSRSKKVMGVPVPDGLGLPRRKRPASTAKALGGAAKEVGKAGFALGELTTEVRKAREE